MSKDTYKLYKILFMRYCWHEAQILGYDLYLENML
jgi:hypothetical protein